MRMKILTILTKLTKEKKKEACLTPGRQKRKEKFSTTTVTFYYESTGRPAIYLKNSAGLSKIKI